MKKILFTLLAAVATLSASAQGIEIYRNGKLVESFKNGSDVYTAKLVKNPKAQLNGKTADDYVEIGGLKWAKMNLGATSVADGTSSFGNYYAWGATRPWATAVTYSEIGTDGKYSSTGITWSSDKTTYSTSTAPHYSGSSYDSYYSTTDHPTLDSYEDAARVNWGGSWRMPTTNDFADLMYACTGSKSSKSLADADKITESTGTISQGGVYWLAVTSSVSTITLTTNSTTAEYKVPGMLFVDQNDITKQVFFPAAGFIYGTSLNNAGAYGLYWSSSLYDTDYAYNLRLRSDFVDPQYYSIRYLGLTVRPVSE